MGDNPTEEQKTAAQTAAESAANRAAEDIKTWKETNGATSAKLGADIAGLKIQLGLTFNSEKKAELQRQIDTKQAMKDEIDGLEDAERKANLAKAGANAELLAAKGMTSATNTSMKAQESALKNARTLNTAAQNRVKDLETQKQALRDVYGDAIDMPAISKDVQSKGIEVLFGDRDSAAALASAVTRRAAAAQETAEKAQSATRDYEDALKAVQDAQARVTTLALNQAIAQSVRAAREAAETRLKEASAGPLLTRKRQWTTPLWRPPTRSWPSSSATDSQTPKESPHPLPRPGRRFFSALRRFPPNFSIHNM